MGILVIILYTYLIIVQSYGGTDPTEADIDKMEQLILNKQTPQLSSTAQLSASNGLRGTSAGMGSKGGSSTRGSLVDLKGSSARLMPDDNDASPGADLMDIDKQVSTASILYFSNENNCYRKKGGSRICAFTQLVRVFHLNG